MRSEFLAYTNRFGNFINVFCFFFVHFRTDDFITSIYRFFVKKKNFRSRFLASTNGAAFVLQHYITMLFAITTECHTCGFCVLFFDAFDRFL